MRIVQGGISFENQFDSFIHVTSLVRLPLLQQSQVRRRVVRRLDIATLLSTRAKNSILIAKAKPVANGIPQKAALVLNVAGVSMPDLIHIWLI
jgi:hypothetical protein